MHVHVHISSVDNAGQTWDYSCIVNLSAFCTFTGNVDKITCIEGKNVNIVLEQQVWEWHFYKSAFSFFIYFICAARLANINTYNSLVDWSLLHLTHLIKLFWQRSIKICKMSSHKLKTSVENSGGGLVCSSGSLW